jgi:hypothetical protein
MHRGVLRDIQREQAEQALAAALAAAAAAATASSGAGSGSAAAAAGGEGEGCDTGICDLSQTRFRDPITGHVVGGEGGSAGKT